MHSWYWAVMKARHLNRWVISLTRLDWSLIAATTAALSDLTSKVLPRKCFPQMAATMTIGVSSLLDMW